MRIEHFLRDAAVRNGDKVALLADGRRITYGELDEVSDRLAHALSDGGVSRGDRIVIFMDNSWQAVACIFAALKAGAIFSPINPSTKLEKLVYVINNCRPVAMLTQERLLSVASAALANAPSVVLTIVSGSHDVLNIRGVRRLESVVTTTDPKPQLPEAGIDLDLAMIVYTSGSTGFPKGVMKTHQNVIASVNSVTTYLENTPDDIILNVLPISYSYGLYQVFMTVILGATLILEKSFTFPHAIFSTMAAERVTGFPIVPTMAAPILQIKNLKHTDFPHLRYITSAASPLPIVHVERLQDLFPTAKLFLMYGMTECHRGTWLPPHQLRIRPNSVGIAIPNTDVYVVDDDGERVAAGVVGELVIRGPHVMKGYWEDPEATDLVLRSGPYPWEKVLYTGDLFRMDEEGYFYFVSRKDDIIKSGGHKVSPKEVENVLYAMPEIGEAVVVGVPDLILGMLIKAVVVVAPGATLTSREIFRHCSKHLEDFMVPKIVEFCDELPKTESGKISRRLAKGRIHK